MAIRTILSVLALVCGLKMSLAEAAVRPSECASLLVNSYLGLVDVLIPAGDLEAIHLDKIKDLDQPAQPFGAVAKTTRNSPYLEAFNKIVPRISAEEWEFIRAGVKQRLQKLKGEQQVQQTAQLRTENILNPRLLSKIDIETHVTGLEWVSDDKPKLFVQTYPATGKKIPHSEDRSFSLFSNAGSKVDAQTKRIRTAVSKVSPKLDKSVTSDGGKDRIFTIGEGKTAVHYLFRTLKTGPISTSYRPAWGRNPPMSDPYEFRDMEAGVAYTHQNLQIFRVTGGKAVLLQDLFQGPIFQAWSFDCLQNASGELDCAVGSQTNGLEFMHFTDKEMTKYHKLEVRRPLTWMSMTYTAGGQIALAGSDANTVFLYRPSETSEVVRTLSVQSEDLSWYTINENQLILLTTGEKSFVFEPFASALGVEIPVPNVRGNVTPAWLTTKSGRLWLAVVGGRGEIFVMDLLNLAN